VHSGWPTADQRYIIVHDELDELRRGLRTQIYTLDVGDLRVPSLVTSYIGGTTTTDHNGYTIGNRYYVSHYKRGLVIFDVTNPRALSEIGSFDTYLSPAANSAGTDGAWGVYPFLPSGTLLVSDIENGLFLLRKNETLPPPGTMPPGSNDPPPSNAGGGGGGTIDAADLAILLLSAGVRDGTRPSKAHVESTMEYLPSAARYQSIQYNRVGRSGLKLPAVSLGFWHNFGDVDVFQNGRDIARRAFDLGITHFDLANNYGPSPGSAEENFGLLMKKDFMPYRDELVISSKAGYLMWPGPYGEWGSRKYLVASCDQSLKRMGLSYVDIFYSHRFDPETPLEETMGALDYIVRSGRALYAGISSYNPEQTAKAAAILRDLGTPCLIHQPSYSMFNRWIEDGLLDVLDREGMGCIVFSPLAQGLLTNKYLNGIPEGSRASKHTSLDPEAITPDKVDRIRKLNDIAKSRGQSLAQLAVAWTLRHKQVTSSLIGASKVAHVEEAVAASRNATFTSAELAAIEAALK
jgi:L-glyceraldehyde 3-phosphate reductase